ncbi:MAG: VTT domain-containing protein [Acidimicrobiia bacterium]|jgi:membrane protein DedA with SNARE-associated domain|nr:VTT domain-containing protein [Acidimicrobiia bacterium]
MHLDDRARLALLVVPIALVAVASSIGEAISPTLLVDAPLLLVALVPRNRYLVLAAPQLAFWPFFIVGMVRLTLTDPLFYLFGRRHGDAAIHWTERRVGAPGSVRRLEQWFRRAAYPVVTVAPNNLVCVLAGASGMSIRGFLLANLGGTAARMVLIWWLGSVFSEPLLDVVEFVNRYRWILTAVTVAVVAVSVWRARRSHRSEIETPEEVAEELET